jgi:hypothetical protein
MRKNRKYSNKKRCKQYKYSKSIRGGENSPPEESKRRVTGVFTKTDPFLRTIQTAPTLNTIKAKFSEKDPFENIKTNVYEELKKAKERAKEEDNSWITAINKDSMQPFTFERGGRKKFTKRRKTRKSLIRKKSNRRH